MIDCPQYDTCSAPLCPLDLASLHGAVWYANEEVCRKSHGGPAPQFIRVQRRIARLKEPETRGYFTYAMLDAVGKVTRGTTGLDVDGIGDKATQERNWIGRRKKCKATPEQRQRLRDWAKQRKGGDLSVRLRDSRPVRDPEGVPEGEAGKPQPAAPFGEENAVSATGAVSGRKTPVGVEVAK